MITKRPSLIRASSSVCVCQPEGECLLALKPGLSGLMQRNRSAKCLEEISQTSEMPGLLSWHSKHGSSCGLTCVADEGDCISGVNGVDTKWCLGIGDPVCWNLVMTDGLSGDRVAMKEVVISRAKCSPIHSCSIRLVCIGAISSCSEGEDSVKGIPSGFYLI